MTATVPTNEPFQARAGDTWAWRRESLTDPVTGDSYAASSWTLKYAFKNAAAHFEATATADGDNFAVTVTAVNTLAIAAGNYAWAAWVEQGSGSSIVRHTVDQGTLEVLPAFAQASQVARDDRTHARIVLEAIEAVIENRATLDQQEYSIGSRSLKRIPVKELIEFRGVYRGYVVAEENQDRIANGKPSGRVVVKL